MNEELYAAIGRKQVELDSMHTEYNKLLSLLSSVVSGDVNKERVTVDLKARTWVLTEEVKEEASNGPT